MINVETALGDAEEGELTQSAGRILVPLKLSGCGYRGHQSWGPRAARNH